MGLYRQENGCMILILKIIKVILLKHYYNKNNYQYHIIGKMKNS